MKLKEQFASFREIVLYTYALNLAAVLVIGGSECVLGDVDPAVCCYSLCANLKKENKPVTHNLQKWFTSSKTTKLPMHASLQGRSQLSARAGGTGLTKGKLLLRGIGVRYDYYC